MKTKEDLEKEWKEKGFSCDLWVDPPGQRWEGYIHTQDELLYVQEGELEFEMNGKKQTLVPGDEAFIPAHMTHSVRNICNTTARWYYGYNTKKI